MKIVAVSDLHGNLPTYLPKGDLLIIGGDAEPDGISISQAQWYNSAFRKLFNKIRPNYDHVILYFGNHSFIGECIHQKYGEWEKCKEVLDSFPLEYITLGQTSYKGYSIAVTSYCMRVGRWAFGWEEDDYARWLEKINKCDIMLCHGPPWAMLDEAYRFDPNGIRREHTGSKELASWVMRVRPQLLICNHIHEAYGSLDIKHYDGSTTTVLNVSQCDRGNNFKDRPVELFIPDRG